VIQEISRATAVLVHAAWFDGSSWARVIGKLDRLGTASAAVQLPLTSLSDDAAAVRRVIDRQPGPVILVGHSYGGANARVRLFDTAHLAVETHLVEIALEIREFIH